MTKKKTMELNKTNNKEDLIIFLSLALYTSTIFLVLAVFPQFADFF